MIFVFEMRSGVRLRSQPSLPLGSTQCREAKHSRPRPHSDTLGKVPQPDFGIVRCFEEQPQKTKVDWDVPVVTLLPSENESLRSKTCDNALLQFCHFCAVAFLSWAPRNISTNFPMSASAGQDCAFEQ